MRVALLCDDRVAIPALDSLVGTGMLVAVGIRNKPGEVNAVIRQRAANNNVPLTVFRRSELLVQLRTWLKEIKPDVVLVKTFPFLIPAEALWIPQYGFINFHYAPLPAYRGANPLFWMIRNRVSVGGVTAHQMTESYDEGPILGEQPLQIGATVNYGILYTQLAYAGVQLTSRIIAGLKEGTLTPAPQDHDKAGWYARPTSSDLVIDWQQMTAEDITALVKACNPWNKGAATSYQGWRFGITYASVVPVTGTHSAGTILSMDPANGFAVASADGKAVIAEVVYCEEGFFPGYCMSAFGLQINGQLS